MCGRFTLTSDPNTIQAAFPGVSVPSEMTPRYNVAPTQPVAVIPNDGNKAVDFFVWGLIPSWAKDPKIGSRMINARSETLAEKPSFKAAYRRRRCLILADGFYEWQKRPGVKSKVPHYLRLESGEPFGLAGLWERWFSPDGSEIKSCTIITTEPNELVEKVHNRMPVIMHPGAYDDWLDPEERDPESLQHLLAPFPAIEMVAYPVSTMVNSPANDVPELVTPA
ncbi:MAG: SOS response-associated peptidase [Anaerolineales bacterium]|nr:SOS response-associated peptidase [Anaerolineales bacterium]